MVGGADGQVGARAVKKEKMTIASADIENVIHQDLQKVAKNVADQK